LIFLSSLSPIHAIVDLTLKEFIMSFTPTDSSVARTVTGADYAELRRTIIAAGLLKRAYMFYLFRSTTCFALLGLALALFFFFPATFGWTVLATLMLGFSIVQVALIGHDAGHQEIFRDNRKNWALGQLCWTLTVGVSFWYWNDRHNRHHGHTNDVTEDPDIQGEGLLSVSFTEHDGATRSGWRRIALKYQPVLIFIGVLSIAFAFRVEGALFTLRRLRGTRRCFEAVLLLLNMLLWIMLIAIFGWRGLGLFLCTTAVASLYLTAIIAPNHNGMPVWAMGATPSFLERQVLSSRNITSHPVWDYLFGGLNFQIEHHLFPTMPRVHLKRARSIVKPFCAVHGLSYEEVDPITSYRKVYTAYRGLRLRTLI
jgi:fatty acid desaturase